MKAFEDSGQILNEYFFASLISACGTAKPPDTSRAEAAFLDLVQMGLRPQSVKRVLSRVLGEKRAAQLLERTGRKCVSGNVSSKAEDPVATATAPSVAPGRQTRRGGGRGQRAAERGPGKAQNSSTGAAFASAQIEAGALGVPAAPLAPERRHQPPALPAHFAPQVKMGPPGPPLPLPIPTQAPIFHTGPPHSSGPPLLAGPPPMAGWPQHHAPMPWSAHGCTMEPPMPPAHRPLHYDPRQYTNPFPFRAYGDYGPPQSAPIGDAAFHGGCLRDQWAL